MTHTPLSVFAVVIGIAVASACARPPAPPSLTRRALDPPAAPGSGQPNVTATADGRVLLSWIEPAGEGAHRLRFSTREGDRWTEPRTIAEGRDWFVNWADFPSARVLDDGSLFAHWLAKSGDSRYAYDVNVAASRDGGRTWMPPVVPHRDRTASEHGFVSMIPWTASAMGLVWLDGRRTPAAHGEAEGHGGAMTLMHATMDASGSLGAETVLDDRVCDCCQTDAAAANGAVVVVYRDRSETEVRDISVVRFAEGRWTPSQPLARDGWQINGCPVNGPAVAASGSNVAAAWFTAASGTPRVKVAFSNDSGGHFGAPVVVDEGRPLGRVDVALRQDGSALVAWLERTDAAAVVRLRHVDVSGHGGAPITVADSGAARSTGFPRMALVGDELVIAWRDAAEPPRVRAAVVSVARSR